MKNVILIAWLAGLNLLSGFTDAASAEVPRHELRDFVVRLWSKVDGLPDAAVTALWQTEDGYLWVGTGVGLVRFDGVRFTPVALRSPGPEEAISITALSEDRSGRLWVGTKTGLFCLAHGTVKYYGKGAGLLDEGITSLAIDAEGGVWIGTRRGLNRWDRQRFQAWTVRDGLPDDWVSGIHAARSKTVWITTRGGICSYGDGRLAPFEFQTASQGRNAEFLGVYEDVRRNLWAFGATYLINVTEGKRFNYFHGEEPASMRIWSLCEGRDGQVWIGTSGRGLFCFDGNRFQPATFQDGTGPNDVRAICEDREGNLWLGVSGGGLARLRPQSYVLYRGFEGGPAGSSPCIAMDGLGRVQVGLEWGGILVHMVQRLEKVADPGGLLGRDSISALCFGTDGSTWVASPRAGLYGVRNGRVLQVTTANGLADDCLLALAPAADGGVWIGTRAGILHHWGTTNLSTFGLNHGLPGTPITALLAAREGGAWVGTDSGVLLRCSGLALQRMAMVPSLAGKPILALYEDSACRLWVGSAGGLGCLASSRAWGWKATDGLPDDVISGIVEDPEQNLWLVTGRGICRVAADSLSRALAGQAAPKAKLVFETTIGGGPPRPGGNHALCSAEGRLWFATPDGLWTANAQDWRAEPRPPPVYLNTVLVNHRPLWADGLSQAGAAANPGEPLRMPANLQSLEIQFTGLSFTAPERVQFRHKLEGFDTDWAVSGSERRVRYGRLPPGPYLFRVTACNGDGIWNEAGASLAFVVPVPLWRTPWLLGLYGLAGTGMLVGAVRLVSHRRLRRRLSRLEQQQSMERERVRIAQDMHDEIGSKLTKISFMSERAKVDLKETGPVVAQIDAIAHTSRELLQALDEIVWAVNPRNDNTEHLATYLAQYAADYFHNTSVECDVRLPSELPQQVMSAETRHNLFLAFEEALNNVLKHSGASHVKIEIGVHQGRLCLRVQDNGRGFDAKAFLRSTAPPHGGNGLGNMQDRLRDIGGRCEIESQLGAGTTVTLSLALNSVKLPG